MHNLGIDNKVKSNLYFDPHFDAEKHLSNLNESKKQSILTSNPNANFGKSSLVHTHDSYRQVDPHMSRYGEAETLKDARRDTGYKFYDNFTKRFDQTHLNSKLRGPQYIN